MQSYRNVPLCFFKILRIEPTFFSKVLSGRFATLDQVLDFYDNIADGRSQSSDVRTAQIDTKMGQMRV